MQNNSSISLRENEVYQEIWLFDDDVKIGEAEVDLKGHTLARLVIFEPYQNKGYGTEIVKRLNEQYDLTNLWVRSDNPRAIHVYEKCGYKLGEAKMYEMTRISETDGQAL